VVTLSCVMMTTASLQATPMTTRYSTRSTTSTNANTSTPTAPGKASKMSNSPPSNTSTGSTTGAATERSSPADASSQPPPPTKRPTTVTTSSRPGCDSINQASTEPGVIQIVFGFVDGVLQCLPPPFPRSCPAVFALVGDDVECDVGGGGVLGECFCCSAVLAAYRHCPEHADAVD